MSNLSHAIRGERSWAKGYRAIVRPQRRWCRHGWVVFVQVKRYVNAVGDIWDWLEMEDDSLDGPRPIGHWFESKGEAEAAGRELLREAERGYDPDEIPEGFEVVQ